MALQIYRAQNGVLSICDYIVLLMFRLHVSCGLDIWKIPLSTRLLSITTGLCPILLSSVSWSDIYRSHKGPLILKGAKWLWQKKNYRWCVYGAYWHSQQVDRAAGVGELSPVFPGLRSGPGLWSVLSVFETALNYISGQLGDILTRIEVSEMNAVME